MVEFKSREDIETWLQDRPREDAIILTARAALRVLPVAVRALPRDPESVQAAEARAAILLPIFRATAAPRVAAIGPTRVSEVRKATDTAATTAEAAGDAARVAPAQIAGTAAAAAAAYATAAAATAAAATAATVGRGVAIAARAAAFAAAAAADAARAARIAASARAADATTDAAFAADAAALEEGQSAAELATLPLWRDDQPVWAAKAWADLWEHLLNANEGWEVWIDWYKGILNGGPIDKELEEARVLIDPALWGQGPKAVNAEIKRLIEAHLAKRTPLARKLSVNPKTGKIRAEAPKRRQTIGKGISHAAMVRNACEKAAEDIAYLREPQRWNQFSVLARQFDVIDGLLDERRLRPERLHDAFRSCIRAIDSRLEERLLDPSHELDELRSDLLHGMSDLRHQFPDLDAMVSARNARRPKTLTPEEAEALDQVVSAVEKILERQLKIELREDAEAVKADIANLPPEARDLPLPPGETKNRVYNLIGTLVRIKAMLSKGGTDLVALLDKGVNVAKKAEAYQKAYEKLEPMWKQIWALLRSMIDGSGPNPPG